HTHLSTYYIYLLSLHDALPISKLNGRLHGMALRVPTPNVSLVDLVVDVDKNVSVEDINASFERAAQGDFKGIIHYSNEPLVSIEDRKSTRLNSSHVSISYAVFC